MQTKLMWLNSDIVAECLAVTVFSRSYTLYIEHAENECTYNHLINSKMNEPERFVTVFFLVSRQ